MTAATTDHADSLRKLEMGLAFRTQDMEKALEALKACDPDSAEFGPLKAALEHCMERFEDSYATFQYALESSSSKASSSAVPVSQSPAFVSARQEYEAATKAYEASPSPATFSRYWDARAALMRAPGDEARRRLDARRSSGRPVLDESSPTVMVSVRMTERHRHAFKALGGSEWLRDRIDDALRSAGALRDGA